MMIYLLLLAKRESYIKFWEKDYHTIMFFIYALNIIIYIYDSYYFNYHSTIMNTSFNHHFLLFHRKEEGIKALKSTIFEQSLIFPC